MKFRKINIMEIRKETIVRLSFQMGMIVAFLGSLNPWFMWPLGIYYIIISSVFFLFSMSMSMAQRDCFYNRYDVLLPTISFAILAFYQSLTRGRNLNSFIADSFHVFIFFSLFRVNLSELRRFMDGLAKGMGAWLAISMSFFLLYLIGFPLPGRDAAFLTYSYTNYYFFLLDDRFLFTIIPRFHSVFLEPGHMGTMTVMLLFTQIGKWKRWYNVSLIIATFISFSLAAYGLFIALIFLSLWIRRRHIVRHSVTALITLGAMTVGAFFYNGGDNMLHDLIVLRLEIDDGEMAGDNRVTDDFKADYEQLWESSDVIWGRERDTESWGNSGYRVYIYDYGLIGLLLFIVFYVLSMYNTGDQRIMIALFIIAALNFIIRGYPLWYANYFPLYYVAKCLSERSIFIQVKDTSTIL